LSRVLQVAQRKWRSEPEGAERERHAPQGILRVLRRGLQDVDAPAEQ
jgi:hypothetical protein